MAHLRKALKFGDALWKPDSVSTTCMRCDKPFIIFTRRRHHCRSCGDIVCHPCSANSMEMLMEYGNKEIPRKVRVCDLCFSTLNNASALSNPDSVFRPKPLGSRGAGSSQDMDSSLRQSRGASSRHADLKETKLFYETKTVCPKCAVVDRKGFDPSSNQTTLLNARVAAYGHVVKLVSTCPSHGTFQTVVSEDSEYFDLTQSHGVEVKEAPGIEEMIALMNLEAEGNVDNDGKESHVSNLPLLLDLVVYERRTFQSRHTLERQLAKFQSIAARNPNKRKYVVQFQCGLVPKQDIAKLNQILKSLEQLVQKGCPVLVNMPFDRMVDLSNLEDTVFLKGRVFPCLKGYMMKGSEIETVDEIRQVLSALRDIARIKLIMDLVVERSSMPNLTSLFELLTQYKSMIPLVIFTSTRSLSQTHNKVLQWDSKDDAQLINSRKTLTDATYSTGDPMGPQKLLEAIRHATDGNIKSSDVFPLGPMMFGIQPFLSLIQNLNFVSNLNYSPRQKCTLATCILSTPSTSQASKSPPQGSNSNSNWVCLSRVFDIKKLTSILRDISGKLKTKEDNMDVTTLNASGKH
eukprot:CAMPEP_0184503486 /NCGR_PEP_ID=MMETSP0113_2-20130426/51919_1 /TAXON_ID=91329 /ORGANISM="Norrisiella sphaerica, Strain BC52" /LENGTH=574 /DNA_ID=CAMNT_0026892989 /DNA_START=122 /DNA_END=1847 /DNA_ORIENTATION=-